MNNDVIKISGLENVENDINKLIQFNTNEYDNIINICDKYQPDINSKKHKYNLNMMEENKKLIDELQNIETKDKLYEKFENDDSYKQYHSDIEIKTEKNDNLDYLRSILYCIKK